MKIVRSRNVVFLEDQTIHDIQRFEKSKPIVRNSWGETLLKEAEPTQMIETNQTEQPPRIKQLDQIEQSQMEHPTQIMEESTMKTIQTEDESQVRRSTRVRQPSKRYFFDEYVNLINDGEPQSFQEAIEIDDKEKGMQAMKEDCDSLDKGP